MASEEHAVLVPSLWAGIPNFVRCRTHLERLVFSPVRSESRSGGSDDALGVAGGALQQAARLRHPPGPDLQRIRRGQRSGITHVWWVEYASRAPPIPISPLQTLQAPRH